MEVILNDVLNQMKCSFTDPVILYIYFTLDVAFHCLVCGFASVPYGQTFSVIHVPLSRSDVYRHHNPAAVASSK